MCYERGKFDQTLRKDNEKLFSELNFNESDYKTKNQVFT